MKIESIKKKLFGIVIETTCPGSKFVTFFCYSMKKYDECTFHWRGNKHFVNLALRITTGTFIHRSCALPTTTRPRLSSYKPICGWNWNALIFFLQPKHGVFLVVSFQVTTLKTDLVEDLGNSALSSSSEAEFFFFIWWFSCLFVFLGKANRHFILTWCFMTFSFLRRRGCFFSQCSLAV